MALKVHIIRATLKELYKYLADARSTCNEAKNKNSTTTQDDSSLTAKQPSAAADQLLITYAKHLLLHKDQDQTLYREPPNVELLLRQALAEYPYGKQSVIVVQTAKTLASTPVGAEPTAWTLIHQILMGHRMLADERFCASCANPGAAKRCAACHALSYCSARCQKIAWNAGHKKWCKTMAGWSGGAAFCGGSARTSSATVAAGAVDKFIANGS